MSEAAIFISYRRKDATPYARSIHERLAQQFGEDRVFMDLTIPPGMDFLEVIHAAIRTSGAILVVIGPNWLVDPGTGRNRLEDPEDYVLLEVVTAMEEEDLVIPVLVGGATMPRREDLPEAIRPLARREAIEISDQRWNYDMGRLSERLQQVLSLTEVVPAIDEKKEEDKTEKRTEERKEKRDGRSPPVVAPAPRGLRLKERPKLAWGALAAAVLVAGGITFAALSGGGDEGGGGGRSSGNDGRPTFGSLSQGAVGPDVERLETRLDELGFTVDPLNTEFDDQTARAVFAFELCWGLTPPDDVADPDMQSELFDNGKETVTQGDDALVGTGGPDIIFLLEGNDTYDGLGGDDKICAGEGGDDIVGGEGNDHLYGGAGSDVLSGGPGDDTLIGFKDADDLDGGEGIDICFVDSADTADCEFEEPQPAPPG